MYVTGTVTYAIGFIFQYTDLCNTISNYSNLKQIYDNYTMFLAHPFLK